MKKQLLLPLAALAVLATGCPRNEYAVELTPRGNTVERKLTFYRADGQETNGTPKYQEFPSNELAAITKLYPAGGVKQDGERHVATGAFSGALPADLRGAGSYSNLTTSLGSAGFYLERFRGNDDPAGMTLKRFQAADQLTDLVIGWAQIELGKEPGFAELRRFLDVNLRHDLKNLSAHFAPVWQFYSARKQVMSEEEYKKFEEQALEDQIVRYGQYLIERGYLQAGDLANLMVLDSPNKEGFATQLIRRLVAAKLGLAPSQPPAKPLAFLASPEAMEQSWTNYLATTQLYQAKVREWESRKDPDASKEKPKPDDVTGDLVLLVVGLKFELGGTDDNLVVNLALPAAPLHTNGKWYETRKKVVWEWDMEEQEKAIAQPAFCYANWSTPNRDFQTQHFGRVFLNGEDLCRYCLWRDGLDNQQAGEWDALLAGLQPGAELTNKLAAFRFSSVSATNQPATSAADFGRQLIGGALEEKKEGNAK